MRVPALRLTYSEFHRPLVYYQKRSVRAMLVKPSDPRTQWYWKPYCNLRIIRIH
jgi:hypothetical protein